MTAVLLRPESPAQWGMMPGWNIVADLTPPELINSRQLAVFRRRVLLALVAVVVLCVAAYGYAFLDYGKASDNADAASSQTVDLTRAGTKYTGITRIETEVDTVRGQVAGVMADDVDVAKVIAAIRATFPSTMSIQNLSLTLTPATTGGTVGLDTSGQAQIGTVTLSGTGRTLDDVAGVVDRLTAIKGVVNVLPGSNQVTAGVAQFNITLTLNDLLYTHRYDLKNTGGS